MQRSSRRLLVPFAASLGVFAAAAPSQAPDLGPSTLLADAAAPIGIASGTQRAANMARGSGSSLLVFEDTRGGDTDVFGVRVDATGALLDAVPFAIDQSGGHQRTPKVAWNGTDWLVVYTSEVDPGSGYFAPRVTARRVSSQGAVLDAAPLAIALDNTGLDFAVASDGVDWVIAYSGYSAGTSDLRARRVTGAGAVLNPGGVVVQASPGSILFNPSVAWAGTNYLFTWSGSTVQRRRMSATLTAVDAAAVSLPTGNGVVLGNGVHFLIAWVRQTPQFTQEVVAQRFAPTMAALDPAPVPLSMPAITPAPSSVAAAWDGTQWIVAWQQPATDSRAARFSSTGAVLDPGGVEIPDGTAQVQYSPSLGALANGGALLLWHEARFGSADDVYGVPFTANGSVGAEQCCSLGGEAMRESRVAAAGDGYLATAVAELSDGSRFLVWRLDALGRPLDAQPIVAATGGPTQIGAGASAWNGTCHLVVWSDAATAQIHGRRLLPDGQWLDAAPYVVMPGFAPDVAANGSDFLVTGLRYPSYPQFVYSYAVRVRGSDGAVLDSAPRLVGDSFARRVRVVALGANWLVATQSHWSHNDNQGGIDLRFVDPAGTVTPVGSIAVLNMQGGGIVDVASAGSSALVAAQSGSNWTNTEVVVQRVLPNGAMPAPMFAITNASPNGQSRPAVVWNGREYVVTYETYQNNVWSYDFEPDVHGIRIAESGAQLDPSGHPFWNGAFHEQRSDGAGLGDGRALHAASVWDPALAAMRVAVRHRLPVGLAWAGTGTPGCSGDHGIDANGAPVAGDAAFAVRCDRGPANGIGVFVLGTAPYAPGFDPGLGVLLHFDLAAPNFAVLFLMGSDADGRADVGVPLVPTAAWAGFSMVAQGLFLWSGPCLPSSSGFSSTPGLAIEVQ